MIKKCELLAPAGGMKQLIAAVENGADAVYMGGQLFNARINADNFTMDELKKAIDYAHIRDVKVYITVNTLFKDEELEEGIKYAAELYEMGADALIVQDMGFGSIIRRLLPDFPLHFSTQGSIYNRRGADAVSRLGYERVVPARELSLDEIKDIAQNSDIDIEVFVHGALCLCYSGQCQLSRIIGGRSGNRGMCAQPCRLPYETDKGKGYYLSPKDICTVDYIDKLIEAEVASFKIEGRMKSAEYVGVVTSIYRKYIDMYYDKGIVEIDEEDRWALLQIFNRGGFSEGYLFENPGKKLLSGNIPKHQGIYIGRAAGQKGSIISARLEKELKTGDGIEIHSREKTGNIVTYIEKGEKGITFIGDIRGKVEPGSAIYRTSSISQLKEIRRTFEEEKCIRKAPVIMDFRAYKGQKPVLSSGDIKVYGDKACEAAINRPLDKDTVIRQLGKTGNTPFYAEKISVECEEGISVPVSTLNAMRRELLELAASGKITGREKPSHMTYKQYDRQDCNITGVYLYEAAEEKIKEAVLFLEKAEGRKIIFIPLKDYMEKRELYDKESIEAMPYISNITKGEEDRYIENNLEIISEAVKSSGIMIGNICWVDEFIKRGITVYGGYGLNVFNMETAGVLSGIGVKETAPSVELLDERWGRLPLMVSEHMIGESKLIDRKNKRYNIVVASYGDKCMVTGGKSGDFSYINSENSKTINCFYL